MSDELENCPNCGSDDIDREEADVGVGVIYGPWGCRNCHWSSDPYWDSSKGEPPAAKDYPGFYCSPNGGVYRKEAKDAS